MHFCFYCRQIQQCKRRERERHHHLPGDTSVHGMGSIVSLCVDADDDHLRRHVATDRGGVVQVAPRNSQSSISSSQGIVSVKLGIEAHLSRHPLPQESQPSQQNRLAPFGDPASAAAVVMGGVVDSSRSTARTAAIGDDADSTTIASPDELQCICRLLEISATSFHDSTMGSSAHAAAIAAKGSIAMTTLHRGSRAQTLSSVRTDYDTMSSRELRL